MPIEITVPRLGWSMDEGTFSSWLKKDGDEVQAGEPLFSLESDKVTMDVESLDSGILHLPPDAPTEGDTVVVGQRIGYLLASGEPAPRAGLSAAGRAPGQTRDPHLSANSPTSTGPSPASRSTRAVTPRARRVAAELGVDTSAIAGTGRDGRVRERDVRAAAADSADQACAEHAPPSGFSELPLSSLRRAVAMRMMESRNNTVPVTLTCRVDATNLVQLRQLTGCSYTDAFVVVVARALKDHPTLAGKWAIDRILIPRNFDIAVAVDTPRGLMVPVMRNAGHATLLEVSQRFKALISAVRAGPGHSEDLSGGCFTISNLGAYGIEAFTPVINYPENAVLGVGAIILEPVALPDGSLTTRHQVTLSLTFDHRVTDGAPAARFLQTIRGVIESSELLKLAT